MVISDITSEKSELNETSELSNAKIQNSIYYHQRNASIDSLQAKSLLANQVKLNQRIKKEKSKVLWENHFEKKIMQKGIIQKWFIYW